MLSSGMPLIGRFTKSEQPKECKMNNRPHVSIIFILLLIILTGGCALLVGMQLDHQFGLSSPQNRMTTPPEIATVTYVQDVKPILESRCIVCHGCYDAPCQLDLSAHEGIERGANKDLVYNAGRLLAHGFLWTRILRRNGGRKSFTRC
jgi:hypothetical protein